MLPEAVRYYSSVIVCKPYRTILRGSTSYGGSLLSPLKPCVEHVHRIVTDGARGLLQNRQVLHFTAYVKVIVPWTMHKYNLSF